MIIWNAEHVFESYTLRIDIGTRMKKRSYNEWNSNENIIKSNQPTIGSTEIDSDTLSEEFLKGTIILTFLEKWLNLRITPPTTKPRRLTETVSRSQDLTSTLL